MNQDVMNVFNAPVAPPAFDRIRISIASPERILSWSFGEIKKPETINYRTFKPERDGLFCARIFGPTKDYECLCGKYKRMKHKGIVCEKCGVEVTLAKVRRERMGHIDLAAPVAHIWFMKSLPSRIALLLDMMLKELERVLYFEKFIVVEPGLTSLKHGQLLSEEELADARDEYGDDAFTASIGAEAVRELLMEMDLKKILAELHEEIASCTSELKSKKLFRRLKLVEAFIESGNRPEWMIMTVIPVIPPELRPLVPLDGGRFATSDLNDLYRRVINRNNRLKKLMELRAPDIIIRNEKRMLQEAVDALFDNGRRGRVITGVKKRPLKSLADMLKGKQGRFRQNLLGKRVDYSGRSVIVVGPELKLHQVGLPKKMALELFKPFVYARLDAKGYSVTVKQSRKLVEGERPEVWDILEEVIREHPVLVNRAPTLHRLGIQAFEPVLTEGKAIHLHPLVCAAFNADFDGDQMAVHVPLSLEAQLEARVLMMSTNNILHPADGTPIIVPSQDIVLGLYYLTLERHGEPGEGMAFANLHEIEHALEQGVVTLHARIKARRARVDAEGNHIHETVETTPGRMILGGLLPPYPGLPFDLVNRLLTKREISQMVDAVYRHCGQKDTVIFCDQVMNLGFRYATRAGISFGKDDMVIPGEKDGMVEEASVAVKEYEQQYIDGLITQEEKYNRVVDAWSECTNQVADVMMERISSVETDKKTGRDKPVNSIYMMAHSGARGSAAQMKQLAGMRGLMAKPSGEIIETPIISNFKEGLSVLEYFNSTHGARKGLADTALKTANSGYLTRRLVDVAQDSIITEEDCGSKDGITVSSVVDSGELLVALGKRVLGRVPVEDVNDPVSGDLIVGGGEIIDEECADRIETANLPSMRVRSPLTCETRTGMCATCYGRDLARGTPVNQGEAVGVIAAQSIGEPGTQLTMRTFHVGGSAHVVDSSFLESSSDGIIRLESREIGRDSENRVSLIPGEIDPESPSVVEDSNGHYIVIDRNLYLKVVGVDGVERMKQHLDYGVRLLVPDGSEVSRGQRVAEWDPYSIPVLAEVPGKVKYEDLVDEETFREEVAATGISQRVVIEMKKSVVEDSKKKKEKTGADEAYVALPSVEKKKIEKAVEDKTELSPAMVIVGSGGKPMKKKKRKGLSYDQAFKDDASKAVDFVEDNRSVSSDWRESEARYRLSVDSILKAEEGDKVRAGDVLALIQKEGARSSDITGGLPRVAELFEARRPKDHAILSDITGWVEIGKDYKNKRQIFVHPLEEGKAVEYLIPRNRHIRVQDGDVIEQGDYIVDGHPAPHDILATLGVESLAAYLVEEIQQVYRLQGVTINDKHIEVIVRQMLRKVEITEPGGSDFLVSEQVEQVEFEDTNTRLESEGKQPAAGFPVLLGITKASLQTRSFISAASFQETTRVLTGAAVSGKVDMLVGLKENVIVGRLIPAGTGNLLRRLKDEASSLDQALLESTQPPEPPESPDSPDSQPPEGDVQPSDQPPEETESPPVAAAGT